MSGAVQTMADVKTQKTRRKRRFGQHDLAGYLFISPWLIGFFAFTFFPALASLWLAFTDYNVLSAPEWIGLENFHKMFFRDPRYWKSVKATFYYAFAMVPLKLSFALAVAMVLNSGRRLIGVYRVVFYIPSIVGASVAVAVMWREIFGTDGLINFMLATVGILGVPWLGNVRTAIWTLILLAVWQFGSPVLIFLAGLKQIPPTLYESASIDGAGGWVKFIRITLPMLTPIIFFNLVMQMIYGFMDFTGAFIITGGEPLDTTLFYTLYLYKRAFGNLHMGYGAAMALVLLVIVALFSILAFKSSSYWVYYESEEGE